MSSPLNARTANPRLGTYFGIFTSLIVSTAILSLVLEQLGVDRDLLGATILLAPLVLFTVIGIASHSEEPLDYFAAGRRVPSTYNGAVLAISAIGGTGFVSLTGLFFLAGFDAWSIAGGIVAGFVVAGILIAPFLRKFGSFTLASYIGRRFDSRLLRVIAAVLLAPPMLMVLIAELAVALMAARWLTGYSDRLLIGVIVGTLTASVVLGGVRAQSWSGTAKAIAALLTIAVPTALVAVLAGNLPLPQLSHGPTLRAIGRLESLQGVPIPILQPLAFDLPGTGLTAVTQRFATPFGTFGPLAYILASLVVMAGVAAAPWLAPRAVTTPSVYEARKTMGWATVIAGLTLLTLAAIAVFMRDYVMDTIVGREPAGLPPWFRTLVEVGHAGIDSRLPRVPLTSVEFKRDAVLFALPLAAGFSEIMLQTALAGALAAALAAAAATTLALANTITEDVLGGSRWEPMATGTRLALARIAVAVTAAAGGIIAATIRPDPLQNLLWALALSAATAFPVLVLSVWWKRINGLGAAAGMVVGFTVTLIAIVAGEAGLIPFKSVLAGAVGMVASVSATMIVSQLTPPVGKSVLELVAELRVPGGETIHDREMRRLRLRQLVG